MQHKPTTEYEGKGHSREAFSDNFDVTNRRSESSRRQTR